jgi:hypothetical protein
MCPGITLIRGKACQYRRRLEPSGAGRWEEEREENHEPQDRQRDVDEEIARAASEEGSSGRREDDGNENQDDC